MCRISVVLHQHNKGENANRLRRMNAAMHRGGPDDEGIYIDPDFEVGFGHRRLSIIDVSAGGHQPMQDSTGRYVITFNGEIYNYKELRNELQEMGYVFSTASDTEVLLNGYAQWQSGLFSKLKGMFAFVLFDRQKQLIVAVRDHAGIKPLYYGKCGDQMYFSSEIRGLKAATDKWQEDENWPIYFLSFGSIPEPYTVLKQVQQLPKASYLEYDLRSKTYTVQSYRKYLFRSDIDNVSRAIEAVRESVMTSIKRHLIADVETGIFLSGGVDSSIITLASSAIEKRPIKTLSVHFDDAAFSEKKFQDEVVQKTGVHHHSFRITQEDVEEELPEIFRAFDQPSIDGINSYFICKYAKSYGLKVVLSGLGADELFGGYRSFQDTYYSKLKRFRIGVALTSSFFGKYPARKLQFFKRGHGGLHRYFFHRGLFIPADVARILQISVDDVHDALNAFEKHVSIPNDAGGLNQQCFLEENMYMKNQLLRDSDQFSMWHSIELRVPFLDSDVIDTAYAIDPAIKFDGALKKHLLIKAFADVLPESVWNRTKMGFSFPFQNWLQDSAFCRERKENDPALASAYSDFKRGNVNWSRYWSRFVHRNFQAN